MPTPPLAGRRHETRLSTAAHAWELLSGKNVVQDSCLHIEIPGRMPMVLGFGAEYYFETCFLLASISCFFSVLDFSIETLLNWNRGCLRWALHSIRQIALAS
jgi:hypothetical protein